MRIPRPEIFEGQPLWATCLVLIAYVTLGPYMRDNGQSVKRPDFDGLSFSVTLGVVSVFFSLVLKLVTSQVINWWVIFGLLFLVALSISNRFIYQAFINTLVNLYQRRAPNATRALCNQTPCCSDYFRLSIKKYGLLRGLPKGWSRVCNCDGSETIDWP